MRAMALTAAVFGMTLGSLAAVAAPAAPASMHRDIAAAQAPAVDTGAAPLLLVGDGRRGHRHHGHRHWHRGGPPPRHYYRPPPRAYYAPPPRVYYAPPPRAYYAPPPRAYYAPPPGVSLNFRF
jgi:hypothetical protein